MSKSKYYYNPETCHYHPARPTFWGVVSYVLGIVLTSGLFFVGLVLLHDRFTQTDRELQLSNENALLKKHGAVLTAQLNTVESTLHELRGKDQLLHKQIFNDSESQAGSNIAASNAILLADADGFEDQVVKLDQKVGSLLKGSSEVNQAFANRIDIDKSTSSELNHVPTLPPLAMIHLDLILSGFGSRINPFHKGLYEHPGIDLSAPRGTEVLASAPGTIVHISRSSVQAGYGNYIEIDHGNGFRTRYTHLDDIHIRSGQKVSKGQVIGTVGNSGGSTAPHLHYEILLDGKPVDPVIYMVEGLDTQVYNRLASLSSKVNQSLD
jgi:murein DD-endopeptidase MepM/ murein hydrolase activator NlpD